MKNRLPPGLGEILRHLVEQLDRGSQARYRKRSLPFRPRYTPIMRALAEGNCSISEITIRVRITQGAVSQTVKLMEEDGLVKRECGEDARQSIVALTAKGKRLLTSLQVQWEARFLAVERLEQEIGRPLRADLQRVVEALEKKDFSERLVEAEGELMQKETADA